MLRIFGPKRDEVIGGWRKLNNEELHNLYCSPSVIRMIKSRRMKWTRHVAHMREKRNAYRILVRKLEETTRKTRHRWEDNIKMDLNEVVWTD
jgi:acyl-coenzyme A synthetase/AMP-(fatty) acid ligase